MIVEHFGKFSVGGVWWVETRVEDIETRNSLHYPDHREYTFGELEVHPGDKQWGRACHYREHGSY